MDIEYEIAADVHRRLIAALDEITTTAMAVAEGGAADWPYDRGFLDGVITIAEAMREGFNEALARVEPAARPAEATKTDSHADPTSRRAGAAATSGR